MPSSDSTRHPRRSTGDGPGGLQIPVGDPSNSVGWLGAITLLPNESVTYTANYTAQVEDEGFEIVEEIPDHGLATIPGRDRVFSITETHDGRPIVERGGGQPTGRHAAAFRARLRPGPSSLVTRGSSRRKRFRIVSVRLLQSISG